jgi:hypothetical protein
VTMLGELLDGGGAGHALPPDLRAEIAALPHAVDAFARQAVIHFERRAPPEEWATLMSRLAGAGDPGATLLEYIVRWELQATRSLPMERPSHERPQAQLQSR